jgi:Ca-activated chloride channel family protein
MRFLWPQMLWLLLAVPALVGVYVWALRRKAKAALRYASLTLVRAALDRGRQYRPHVPPLLFLLGTIVTFVAISRPTAVITLPSDQRTIILAMDVSLSMRATDVEPSRIVAAQNAAKAFIQEQPPDVRIGIVSFAGTASVVQSPTRDRDDLIAAIDRLELQRHTAIGSGIIVSLATIFPDAGIDLESLLFGRAFTGVRGRGVPIDRAAKAERKPFQAVPPGSHSSAAIILLTDGRRTTGPDSLEAAKMAADYGVRVFTVGFGAPGGGMASFEGYSIYMQFDEESLQAIADMTHGEYFRASSAAELKKIYEGLNARFVFEKKETEVTALAIGAAAILLLIAALLSLLWFNRIV